jgi:hypothetical protein
MASRHLDHFSKHKEINFDNFITVSLSVDFIISTGKLCSFISPSNLRSFLKDYYRLHRELGSDVPFQLFWLADLAYSVFLRNKQKMDIYFPPWHPIFHKVSASDYIILYKAQHTKCIIVNRK